MSLLDHFRAAGPDAAGGPSRALGGAGVTARGFDHVELPSDGDDKPNRRLSRHQFEALPLEERVGLLAQGTLRFYRGDEEVAASAAMRAVY